MTACSRAAPKFQQVTDDDEPGGDPNATLKRDLIERLLPRHRQDLHDLQAGPHRPFRVVLVSSWMPGIGKHPVAKELGDEALIPLKGAGYGVLVDVNNSTQILRAAPDPSRRG